MRSRPRATEPTRLADWLSPDGTGLRLALRVTPGARRAGVGGIAPGRDGAPRLKVAVTAVPEDGAANAAVLALLAETVRMPKTAFTLVGGPTSRDKIVRVAGEPDEIAPRLRALAETGA